MFIAVGTTNKIMRHGWHNQQKLCVAVDTTNKNVYRGWHNQQNYASWLAQPTKML
jgi:hypothetical protein